MTIYMRNVILKNQDKIKLKNMKYWNIKTNQFSIFIVFILENIFFLKIFLNKNNSYKNNNYSFCLFFYN